MPVLQDDSIFVPGLSIVTVIFANINNYHLWEMPVLQDDSILVPGLSIVILMFANINT